MSWFIGPDVSVCMSAAPILKKKKKKIRSHRAAKGCASIIEGRCDDGSPPIQSCLGSCHIKFHGGPGVEAKTTHLLHQ